MECDGRIKDLLPDFHLGQLPPEEAEEVRRHLSDHPACRDALEEVAEVLDLMPFSAPAAAPPEALKGRVLARVSAPEAAPRPATRERAAARPAGRWRTVVPLSAAAVVLVFLSVFSWTAYLRVEQENERLRAEVQRLEEQGGAGLVVVGVEGTERAPQARGTAVIDPADGSVALDVYNLPDVPEGHSYRAWLVAPDGDAYSLGTMKTDDRGDGRMSGRLPADPTPYDTVQVTTEPLGADERDGPVYLDASL